MSSHNRRIVALALPATVTLLADPIMGVVDTAVVGRLGAAQLGALGLAVSVLAAGSWVFNFLVFGTTSAVARAVGARDREVAGRRISHATQVAVVLGSVVALLLAAVAPWLLRGLGTVAALLEPATTYLRIRAVGIPFLLLAFVGHGAFRGVSDTRTPLLVAVGANLVNAGLTFWFVLGLGWGIAGAGWATVVAEVLTVLAFALLLGRIRLPLAGHGAPSLAELKVLFAVSRDLVLRTGGLVLGLLAVAAAAARVDAQTAAAYQVLYQTMILLSFLMDGLAIAGQALVGTALGAGDRDEARTVGRAVLRWGALGGVVLAVLLAAGAGLWPRILTDDPAVLATVAGAWWLLAAGQVMNGPVYALDGVLMGAEDFRYLRTWTVLAGVVGGVAAQVVASVGGGLLGLWAAVQLLMAVRLVTLLWRIRGEAWLVAGEHLGRTPPD
ncbi:MAG: MATE family efflux transporter [Nitriliruptoraceae bacterium]